MVSIDDFKRKAECFYKGEKYSVRDNGAVLRHSRRGMRIRKDDDQWTFGKPNEKNGYMYIGNERIHRIVAIVFIGEPPTPQHVVDHIDTNRRNNRPENLRWVTKLENALNNPITRKRIILACGSIETFLANPSILNECDVEPDFRWMRTVSANEAQISKERLQSWAKSDKISSGGSLGEWIFEQPILQKESIEIPKLMISKTVGAAQQNWQIPSEFPCCPQKSSEESLLNYYENLKTGSVFCSNDIYKSLVFKKGMPEDHQSIYVISESTEGENAVKPYALAKITYENGIFVHTSLRSFFTKEGAEKQFCIAQGLEWTGEDSIDDYS